MTDEELMKALRDRTFLTGSLEELAADRLEKLAAQLKMVLEREAETQRRHEAREDTIREAALREAYGVLQNWVYCCDAEDEILALIGENK